MTPGLRKMTSDSLIHGILEQKSKYQVFFLDNFFSTMNSIPFPDIKFSQIFFVENKS
jgi:hypothetical protein